MAVIATEPLPRPSAGVGFLAMLRQCVGRDVRTGPAVSGARAGRSAAARRGDRGRVDRFCGRGRRKPAPRPATHDAADRREPVAEPNADAEPLDAALAERYTQHVASATEDRDGATDWDRRPRRRR